MSISNVNLFGRNRAKMKQNKPFLKKNENTNDTSALQKDLRKILPHCPLPKGGGILPLKGRIGRDSGYFDIDRLPGIPNFLQVSAYLLWIYLDWTLIANVLFFRQIFRMKPFGDRIWRNWPSPRRAGHWCILTCLSLTSKGLRLLIYSSQLWWGRKVPIIKTRHHKPWNNLACLCCFKKNILKSPGFHPAKYLWIGLTLNIAWE